MSEWKPITDDVARTSGRYLVTNNINARDRWGDMSHVWIGFIIKSDRAEDGNYVTYNDGDCLVRNLTHYCEIPQPEAA